MYGYGGQFATKEEQAAALDEALSAETINADEVWDIIGDSDIVDLL